MMLSGQGPWTTQPFTQLTDEMSRRIVVEGASDFFGSSSSNNCTLLMWLSPAARARRVEYEIITVKRCSRLPGQVEGL